MILWMLAFALAQAPVEDEPVAPVEPTVQAPEPVAPAPEPDIGEITVWGDLAVQRARTDVVRAMQSMGYEKRDERDGTVVFRPPKSWMGKAFLDYEGHLTFGRPVVGMSGAGAYGFQPASEDGTTNANLSRSPGGQVNPNLGGDGYVLPHPEGSFWIMPSARLLDTTHRRVLDQMTPSLDEYREVVVETRKHQ